MNPAAPADGNIGPGAGSGGFQALRSWSLPSRVVRVLGDPRFRLEGALLALHVDIDGTAWTVEEPGVLRHWTVENGREHNRAALSDFELLWCFSPKANLLASAADDWSLWNRDQGAVLFSVPQSAWVSALAFHPGGEFLATGHDNGAVRLWEVRSGKLRRQWETGEAPISALAFSLDGATLAGATELRDIHLWNVPHGMNIGVLTGHTDRVTALTWHPDHRHLVSAGWDATARLWDTTTGEPLFLLNGHGDQVGALAYAPGGQHLATADSDHVIWLWDPFNGVVLRHFRGHTAEISCLAFTPGGRRLLSGGADGRIVLWDVATGKNLFRSSDTRRTTMRLSLSPGGHQLACLMGGHAVHLWDLGRQPPASDILPVTSEATALAHSGDGKWLAAGQDNGWVQVWNRRNNRPLPPLQEHRSRVSAVAFSPDRPWLASAGGTDTYVYLWSIEEGKPLLLIPEAAGRCGVEAIAFVPGAPWILAAGVDWNGQGPSAGAIRLWDFERPGLMTACDEAATHLCVHPSGALFAAALHDQAVCLFETRTLKLRRELPANGGAVTALAISPDGNWLACAGEEARLHLWSLIDEHIHDVLDLDSPVRDLLFSRDGSMIYTAHANATVYFIDVAEQLSKLGKPGQAVAT
jgi:WD40 repeat protein